MLSLLCHLTIILLLCLDGIMVGQSGDLEPSPCLPKCDCDYRIMQKVIDLENRLKQIEEKKPVSFTAQLSNQMVNPPEDKTVIFDSVQTSFGQGYNPSTGIFSAPYSGVYSFSLVASSPLKSTENFLHLYIMKNVQQIGYIFLDGNSDRWLLRSTSTVVALETGDHVFVKVGRTRGVGTLAGCCFHTVFSGFLINWLFWKLLRILLLATLSVSKAVLTRLTFY